MSQPLAVSAFAEVPSTMPGTGRVTNPEAEAWKPLTAYPDKVQTNSGGYQISGINIELLQARVTELEKQVERLSAGKGRGE